MAAMIAHADGECSGGSTSSADIGTPKVIRGATPRDDFSYRERDLLREVAGGLNAALKGRTIVEQAGKHIVITLVRAYGEAFQSTRRAPKYNGAEHRATLFSLQLEVLWHGRATLGEATIGTASGKLKLDGIDAEWLASDAAPAATVRLDMEPSPALMGNQQQQQQQQGPAAEPSALEAEFKALASKDGVASLATPLRAALRKMLVEGDFSQASQSTPDPAEAAEDEEHKDGGADAADRDGSLADVSDLRRQLLGQEYLRAIEGEVDGEPVWKLRLCTIHDRDLPALCDRLTAQPGLQELDLFFNYIEDGGAQLLAAVLPRLPALRVLDLSHNRLGDVGAQALLTALALGACPQLAELRLASNPALSPLTATVAAGLGALRPALAVRLAAQR